MNLGGCTKTISRAATRVPRAAIRLVAVAGVLIAAMEYDLVLAKYQPRLAHSKKQAKNVDRTAKRVLRAAMGLVAVVGMLFAVINYDLVLAKY